MFPKVYIVNVLLVKVFVQELHLLILSNKQDIIPFYLQNNNFLCIVCGENRNISNNYHFNMMSLTVKIHLEKEPNQIGRQADEKHTSPPQSQGRYPQQNSRMPSPVQGATSTELHLRQRIISWQEGETVILITLAR